VNLIIEQIGSHDPATASSLAVLADRFDYQTIVDLTQKHKTERMQPKKDAHAIDPMLHEEKADLK
jgi:hypothetical protein